MTSRERTCRCIEFRSPDRIPLCLEIDESRQEDRDTRTAIWSRYESDILQAMNGDPEFTPRIAGEDEWGCIWKSMGETMGEVTGIPLPSWDLYPAWKRQAPDFSMPRRYRGACELRASNPDAYIMGGLGALMMSLIYFRGYSGCMTDIHLERRNLEDLIDLIYATAYQQISGYADAGMDAVIAWEDWGLQDRLMIDPVMWRDLFKERMRSMIEAVHDRGMHYILHSCGYIVEILEDLIDVGVDVLQLDQQRLMGIDRLASFAGKVCFFCPADIQFASANENASDMAAYCRELAYELSTAEGGFMYKTYAQPFSVHLPRVAIETECRTFTSCNPYVPRGRSNDSAAHAPL